MRPSHFCLAILTAVLVPLGSCLGADPHRLLVLDVGRYPDNRPGTDRHELLLLGVESGKVLAQVELGFNTNFALSRNGDTVAALTYLRGDAPEKGNRLNLYRAADLSLVQSGRFPIPTRPTRDKLSRLTSKFHFSPSGQEIVLCGLEGTGNVDQATTVVIRVKRELDSDGVFKSATAARISPCRSVDFVSLAGWPRAHVLNHTFTLLQVVELETGEIVTSLPLGDPALQAFDQTSLENADFNTILRVRNKGVVIPGGGPYAYYIPHSVPDHFALPRPLPDPGFLKKIDLSADPPKVTCRGSERQPGLRHIAAVSESAKALFVLEERRNPQSTHEPSRWVKVFSTSDLSFQRQIELPLVDCQDLEVSRDGKYLYALDAEKAKLAIVETASPHAVKVLDVGKYPVIMVALPQGDDT